MIAKFKGGPIDGSQEEIRFPFSFLQRNTEDDQPLGPRTNWYRIDFKQSTVDEAVYIPMPQADAYAAVTDEYRHDMVFIGGGMDGTESRHILQEDGRLYTGTGEEYRWVGTYDGKQIMEFVPHDSTPNASEALWGFVAWLTQLDKPIILSKRHDASGIAMMMEAYSDCNGLPKTRSEFPTNISRPKIRRFNGNK